MPFYRIAITYTQLNDKTDVGQLHTHTTHGHTRTHARTHTHFTLSCCCWMSTSPTPSSSLLVELEMNVPATLFMLFRPFSIYSRFNFVFLSSSSHLVSSNVPFSFASSFIRFVSYDIAWAIISNFMNTHYRLKIANKFNFAILRSTKMFCVCRFEYECVDGAGHRVYITIQEAKGKCDFGLAKGRTAASSMAHSLKSLKPTINRDSQPEDGSSFEVTDKVMGVCVCAYEHLNILL